MRKGDHLFVHRSLIGETGRHYTHHGIYMGHDEVIHYAGYANGFSGGGSRKVERIALMEFAAGQPVQVRQHPGRRYSAEQVMARARSRLGEDDYSLWLRNCEHFATWCCTGEETSEQIRKAARTVARVGATGAGLALARSAAGRGLLQAAGRLAESAGRAALGNPWVAGGTAILAVAGAGYWALRERIEA